MQRIHIIDMMLCLAYTLAMWHFRPDVLDLRNWSLSITEIRLVHNLGLMFVLNNVVPKYMRFTGARRHRNDMGMKKTYLTKNYFRLALHILGGAGVFFLGGFYLQSEEFFQKHLSLLHLKVIFIGFDLLHQATIWLMLRNHDGIFVLRSNNLSLALQKVAMDIQLWEASSFEEARPMIAGLFLATAGFALTRFWCFIVAMCQVLFGRSFDSMRENWYSVGEWLAQLIIMVRMGVCRENNICYILSVFWFPHELWNGNKDDYQDIAKYVAYVPASLYFYGFYSDVTQRPTLTQTSDLVCQLALAIHSMYYCGKYFKREPLPGVDYKSARRSFRNLIERTIVQARKSIFMYGNETDAKNMRASRFQRLKTELDQDPPAPYRPAPSSSPTRFPQTNLVPKTKLDQEPALAGTPASVAVSPAPEPTPPVVVVPGDPQKLRAKTAGRSTSLLKSALKKRMPLPTSNSDSADSLAGVLTPPLATTPSKDTEQPYEVRTGLSDIEDINSTSTDRTWQDPDVAQLPRLSTRRLVEFAEVGTPVNL
jgi:hypothetical protein